MKRILKKYMMLVALLGATMAFGGCSGGDDGDNPTDPNQNNFPSIQGVQISPNAAIYVEDTVTLSPVTQDPNDDEIRYVWSKSAGTFNPSEAVGASVQWTAPVTRGTYQIVVVGDDANGGTSQKHAELIVYGGDQTGRVDAVGGVRENPVGELENLGYMDKGDVITLTWDHASPVTVDSTRPDETKYAPDGSRLNTALSVVSAPQYGYSDGLPVRNAARYSLIGKIDDGAWFEFAKGADSNGDGMPDSFSVTAPARGKLIVSINEQNNLLADNTGYWRLAFTIEHP